jgi:hypothetical protein
MTYAAFINIAALMEQSGKVAQAWHTPQLSVKVAGVVLSGCMETRW